MADFDVDGALRWARFDPGKALVRRRDDELPFVHEGSLGGQPLLLDTCVYIDQLQGRTPPSLDRLVDARQVNHSTVSIQALMHTIGVLDPHHHGTATVTAAICQLIQAMPAHRVFTPDADILGRAALLSGMLCRLQGYGGSARLRAFQDCVLFLQGQKLGFTLLTANIRDFDHLLQLIPTGRVLFYRRV